jgi:hypothetical protein
LLEAILLNQTLPTAHKRRKDPTVTPTHMLKTLFRKVISYKIEDNTLQTFSRFMHRANINDWRLVYLSPLVAEPFLRDVFSTINYVQDSISLIGANLPVLHFEVKLLETPHFQSPEVSVHIAALGFRRACKSQESQSLVSALANGETLIKR